MKETWRWFGPDDPVTLGDARQAGATGIVTALQHIPAGAPWPLDEVVRRRKEVEATAGLTWSVVESVWMPDTIKSRTGPWQAHLEAFKASLRACGQAGVPVVCYNFMPVVDWTRTDLRWPLPTGGYALRFDLADFVAYDAFVLRRPGAEGDYPERVVAEAHGRALRMSEGDTAALERNVIAGLPGGTGVHADRAGLRAALAAYAGLSAEDLRANLVAFLRAVAPTAEEAGVRLCVHPDDPPFPLFGLPRVVSTAPDLRSVLAAADSPANGLTFCSGSLGARGDNEPLADLVRTFGARIHFAHLRNVRREETPAVTSGDGAVGSFHEANHLDGSTDMVAVVEALLAEEARRRAEGRNDSEIPIRPDHGHLLLDDQAKARINPGYSAIGRLKGLAELRGVARALAAQAASTRPVAT